MKNNRLNTSKWFATGLCAIALTTNAFAYGPGDRCNEGGRERGAMREMMFTEVLQLSDAQRQAIDAIRQDFREEKRTNFGKGKGKGKGQNQRWVDLDPGAADYQAQVEQLAEAKSERMKEAMLQRAQMHADIYAILTPEQREKFVEVKQQMRDKRGSRKGGNKSRQQDW